MNKKFIISLLLVALLLSVEAAKVQKEKTEQVETEQKEQESSQKSKNKEEKAKKEKVQTKQVESEDEKPVKEPQQDKSTKQEKEQKATKEEKVQKQEKVTKEEKTQKQEKASKEEKQKESAQNTSEQQVEKQEKQAKEEKVKTPKEKTPKEEKAPKEVKAAKEEKAVQEEKAPKEEKVKAPKEEKVKTPKEEKVKAPKEEKAPKVKLPKIEPPRNFTQEVIAKVAKHTFWNGTLDTQYLTSHKLAGQKKVHCLLNEFNKVQAPVTAAKNLCLINQYNSAFENQWQNWNSNSTAETGRFRFSNNGTVCEQEYNWNLSEVNGTAVENGTFTYTNSTGNVKITCKVSGSKNEASKWESLANYSVFQGGDKRGEVYEKNSTSQTVLNQNSTENTSFSEYVEDTIFLTQAQNKTSKGDNKINRGFNTRSISNNGNVTVEERKWNKSKVILDFVETSAEGLRFGSEHSKVKSETHSITASGVVIQDSGLTTERSRQYYKQTFGPNANNIDYNDVGHDRKWKNNTVRPEKNLDIPANWSVNGTYAVPVQQQQQNVNNFNNKKIDL